MTEFQFLAGAGHSSLCHCVQTSSGAHPASYPMGTGGSFQGCGGKHSLPSSAEVKNLWSYTASPSYVFMALCLGKHRGNFAFTFNMQRWL